jgi:cytochrome oxidase Cu insertion factor (SCO1/SenC/PrrC family)/cytochrome c2
MQIRRRRHSSGIIALFIIGATVLTLGATPATAATGGSDGNGGSIWGAGYFPDTRLVTQEGKSVRFFTDLLKGKVVAISFFYTRDPAETGFETARLREVQKILGDRVGHDVFIYSISIDPEHDTPKVLKEYADKFQAGPGWLFLTGKEADITLLRKKLGLYRGLNGEKLEDHDSRLIIGNQSTGQWMKLSHYENPYILATKLGTWLSNWSAPPREPANYASAPKVRDESLGEGLFRNACATCHTIGGRDFSGTDSRKTGPDLFGVTRKRSSAWLARWLEETDKVLAEKDPIAMELLAKYNNLPMPNMKFSPDDIKALLLYLEEESARLENPQKRIPTGHKSGEHN